MSTVKVLTVLQTDVVRVVHAFMLLCSYVFILVVSMLVPRFLSLFYA